MARDFKRPSDVHRQVKRLITAVNEEHVHAHLGHKTVAAYRRGKQLRKLPADCRLHQEKLPIAVGKVSFIRLVRVDGSVKLLSQSFQVGRRLKHQFIKATIFTKSQTSKVYHKGRIVKHFKYPLTAS